MKVRGRMKKIHKDRDTVTCLVKSAKHLYLHVLNNMEKSLDSKPYESAWPHYFFTAFHLRFSWLVVEFIHRKTGKKIAVTDFKPYLTPEIVGNDRLLNKMNQSFDILSAYHFFEEVQTNKLDGEATSFQRMPFIPKACFDTLEETVIRLKKNLFGLQEGGNKHWRKTARGVVA
jgi:hypothetical protein